LWEWPYNRGGLCGSGLITGVAFVGVAL
jgi:hypothetical protein